LTVGAAMGLLRAIAILAAAETAAGMTANNLRMPGRLRRELC
jgi:hypothetical protein